MLFKITQNPNLPKIKEIKELQSIYIPNVNPEMNIPNLNGFRYVITGPPGAGKSNLLINLFNLKAFYRGKFDNIYVFMPSSSVESVPNHPFKNHPFLFDELTKEALYNIVETLKLKKSLAVEYNEKMKNKKIHTKTKNKLYSFNDIDIPDEDTEGAEEEEPKRIEYSCIVLDDIADKLKDKEIVKALKHLLIQSRHIMCVVIITLQNYFLMDKSLRKLINYISIFEPPNLSEWESYNNELIGLNKENSIKLKNFVYNEKFKHLDIDITNKKYYVNFNKLDINEN